MPKQLSLFPDLTPAPATTRQEAEPTADNSSEFPNSSGILEAPKRKRFLALDDPERPRNRRKARA